MGLRAVFAEEHDLHHRQRWPALACREHLEAILHKTRAEHGDAEATGDGSLNAHQAARRADE